MCICVVSATWQHFEPWINLIMWDLASCDPSKFKYVCKSWHLTFSLRLVNMTEAVSFLPLIWWHPYQMTLGCQSTSLHRRMMIAKCTSIVWRCFTLNGSHSRGAVWPSCPLVGFPGSKIPICGSPGMDLSLWTHCICQLDLSYLPISWAMKSGGEIFEEEFPERALSLIWEIYF